MFALLKAFRMAAAWVSATVCVSLGHVLFAWWCWSPPQPLTWQRQEAQKKKWICRV